VLSSGLKLPQKTKKTFSQPPRISPRNQLPRLSAATNFIVKPSKPCQASFSHPRQSLYSRGKRNPKASPSAAGACSGVRSMNPSAACFKDRSTNRYRAAKACRGQPGYLDLAGPFRRGFRGSVPPVAVAFAACVDSRTINSGVTSIFLVRPGFSSARICKAISAACSPRAWRGISTEERGTRNDSAYRMLPQPITAISSGILSPAPRIAFMAPIAAGSL
jgi:hypothetical protein